VAPFSLHFATEFVFAPPLWFIPIELYDFGQKVAAFRRPMRRFIRKKKSIRSPCIFNPSRSNVHSRQILNRGSPPIFIGRSSRLGLQLKILTDFFDLILQLKIFTRAPPREAAGGGGRDGGGPSAMQLRKDGSYRDPQSGLECAAAVVFARPTLRTPPRLTTSKGRVTHAVNHAQPRFISGWRAAARGGAIILR